ncbi:hypothetical protein [Gluconobacter roseus]|uniref:Uncharacterized protein n=1 Tax=Gluconobacter roseus NBRC 3990 TaxID=1307950 RepID=A0A4Y3M4N0_9PROT|nr:hypothetical protein [Gluconobacter roseus]GBR42293.1 hypothetical protein AA3990_0037 [Gluconobacter roseus NBRC 3990]GEB03573.1 hypothetical protein GRO01_11490 [Gluconobacter roseus NBRC 3990]GLP94028.1 hypothetical protein GCM10007871_20060 [Gluconobacter roseus NBRC 3990]
MNIMKNTLRTLLVPGLFCLASCGGGEPSKAEVKKLLIENGIQQAFLFQNPTQQQRDQAIATLEKKIDLQSVACKPVEGFKKVWDCTVNYMLNDAPQSDKMRFHRQNDDHLAVAEVPAGTGE